MPLNYNISDGRISVEFALGEYHVQLRLTRKGIVHPCLSGP